MVRWRLRFNLQEIDLRHGRTVLGRDADCPITIEDPLVSRQHAEIHVGEEACVLVDLGSRNGVYLNGIKISGATPLAPNDRIRLGRDELVFLQSSDQGLLASARPTPKHQVCERCGHEHAAVVDACPSCGLPIRYASAC